MRLNRGVSSVLALVGLVCAASVFAADASERSSPEWARIFQAARAMGKSATEASEMADRYADAKPESLPPELKNQATRESAETRSTTVDLPPGTADSPASAQAPAQITRPAPPSAAAKDPAGAKGQNTSDASAAASTTPKSEKAVQTRLNERAALSRVPVRNQTATREVREPREVRDPKQEQKGREKARGGSGSHAGAVSTSTSLSSAEGAIATDGERKEKGKGSAAAGGSVAISGGEGKSGTATGNAGTGNSGAGGGTGGAATGDSKSKADYFTYYFNYAEAQDQANREKKCVTNKADGESVCPGKYPNKLDQSSIFMYGAKRGTWPESVAGYKYFMTQYGNATFNEEERRTFCMYQRDVEPEFWVENDPSGEFGTAARCKKEFGPDLTAGSTLLDDPDLAVICVDKDKPMVRFRARELGLEKPKPPIGTQPSLLIAADANLRRAIAEGKQFCSNYVKPNDETAGTTSASGVSSTAR